MGNYNNFILSYRQYHRDTHRHKYLYVYSGYVMEKLLGFYFLMRTLKSNISYSISKHWRLALHCECKTRVVPVENENAIRLYPSIIDITLYYLWRFLSYLPP